MKFSFLYNKIPKRNLLIALVVVFILSLIATFYFKIEPPVVQQQHLLQRYIRKEQKAYERLISDTDLMRKLVQQRESLEEFKKVAKQNFGIFIFAETLFGEHQLLFWNNQKILPPTADYKLPDGEYFQYLVNGYYLTIKKTIKLSGMSNNVIAYTMIPVLYKYFVDDPYLLPHFAHDKSAFKKIALSNTKTHYSIQSLHHKPLFYITGKAYTSLGESETITFILRITTLILLLAYVHFLAETIVRRRGPTKGILFLLSVIILVQLCLYFFPNLLHFRQFELFDPKIYGTTGLHRSLGDLLINVILFCWLVIFAWYNVGSIKGLPPFLKGKGIIAAGILALFFLILSTFTLADIVQSIITDSKISFDVSNVFSWDVYSLIGFIILALISLAYYYFTRLLFQFIFPVFQSRFFFIYFIIALLGLAFLTLTTGSSIILFHLPVLLWLLVYTLLFSQEQFIINRFKITAAGILFWIFVFSVSLAVIILQGNRKKEWDKRKEIAEKLDQLNNPSGEKILSIALTYLDNRFLVKNFPRFKDPNENRYLRDSIITENFYGYNIGYSTKLYVFDSLKRAVNNDDPMSYEELNTIFSVQSQPTAIPDLYYHEISFDKFTYITKRIVKDKTGEIGTFFIISTPKQWQYYSESISPEIFKRGEQVNTENSSIYSYAIYNNRLLISSSTKYPFPIRLNTYQIPTEEYARRINGDSDEMWYKANNKKIIVIVKKQESLVDSITLFSYLFCAFLFMVTVLRFIALLLRASNDRKAINIFWQLNIRSQVHSVVIFISLLSFLIIGVTTISFFISRYNRNNVDKLSRTAQIMVKEMQKQIVGNSIFDDENELYDSVSNNNLKQLVNEVADVHGVDINIYNTDGDLQVTSQENVYDKGVLSTKMHPEAFFHLIHLLEVQYVQEETLSSLQYLSIYTAIRDDKGNVRAYLNIPYFTSQIDLTQEISNFLVTIINLNAFIFLIAGILALFITNTITRSFSVIGDKMKAITLGKTNEEIVWSRNDEIGELVKQYNKMVHQLEQSAEALAKSEREGAWREMARQVAHEIKNPLTPMKLSIQYLQRAINNNQPNVKELTSNVANTLIEQIDHLSKIAADFSQFANIGNKYIEVFDLHSVLVGLVDLHLSNPKVKIYWHKVEGEIMMKADKTHMNRLFTNLLTNSIDACENKERCIIQIEEQRDDDAILIKVKDNGEGIPAEMRSKIFTPNFTTKTSGTGLGLAMCKSIVEQTGGAIWFETEEGKNTTFFVRLPVMYGDL